ncbi:MAG TPA: ATP-binding protein [Chthoniobacteraceae bacterium]|jgi:hypothetical protein|nr:ATP-binding protein [Chthoniobacteraceae bacterium]
MARVFEGERLRINNPPKASALMTGARSFGNYDLAAALADLIDNSLKAGAHSVGILFEPVEDDVIVRIRDNGAGMSRIELIDAMRPASSNPEHHRDVADLGRFGWGLKSASLSQARILTVVTWRDSLSYAARWNIDDLEDWAMDLFEGSDALSLLASAPVGTSGTEVIWTRCDRLYDVSLSATLDERLNEKILHAKKQLSLTFHRYLAGEEGRRVEISVQEQRLDPTDPFMTRHPATQSLDEEYVAVTPSEGVRVKPFVIPHFSKLTREERLALDGDEGLSRNQGFYVYRNRRLIIHGTWFRLVPHGELSQLTRIRIDLPNSLDAEWKITLDKSDAQLPINLRRRLREIVQRFSKRSVGVYRRRGVDLNTLEREPVWRRNSHNGRIRYLINRDHPIVRELLENASDQSTAQQVVRLVEFCVPVEEIAADATGAAQSFVQSITDPDQFDSLIHACMLAYIRHADTISLSGFLAFAKKVEPFSEQWRYAESLIKEKAREWKLK